VHIATHLAEWFLALGAILGETALFKRTFPSTEAFELSGHVTRSTAFIVFCVDFGALLEQFKDADLISAYHSPVKWRKTGIIARVWICTVLEQHFDGERVTLIRGPHEGGVSGGITFIDRDRLVKEV
jgi:hypothetical protein